MSRVLRLRWYSGDGEPVIGGYVVPIGPRCRAAYRVLGCEDEGPRGGLGRPVYTLFALVIERVPRAEALADPRHCEFQWDQKPRKRRAWRLADLKERVG